MVARGGSQADDRGWNGARKNNTADAIHGESVGGGSRASDVQSVEGWEGVWGCQDTPRCECGRTTPLVGDGGCIRMGVCVRGSVCGWFRPDPQRVIGVRQGQTRVMPKCTSRALVP